MEMDQRGITRDPNESVRALLRALLSPLLDKKAHVETLANPDLAARLVEMGQLEWPTLAAIGVHVFSRLNLPDSDPAKAAIRDLADRTRVPIEDLVKSLSAKAAEAQLDDEELRLLFHARFALGFLKMASGEDEEGERILHEVAGTKVSHRGPGDNWTYGQGILWCGPDVRAVKWETCYGLLRKYTAEPDFKEREDPLVESAYLLIEAGGCDAGSALELSLLEMVPLVLASLAGCCEKYDTSRECEAYDTSRVIDSPSVYWAPLFAAAAEALSAYGVADSSGDLPEECAKQSAQFLAWNFGQLAARFCTHERWRNMTFGDRWPDWAGDLDDECLSPLWGWEATWKALSAAMALVCEYGPERDWKSARENYVQGWREARATWRNTIFHGMPISEIPVDSDLYWAMRIGFADKVLESQRALVPVEVSLHPIVDSIVKTQDIASATALRVVKVQETIDRMAETQKQQNEKLDVMIKGMPPEKQKIMRFLQKQLYPVWNKLPSKVVNHLVKAEKHYHTGTDDDIAKVGFSKAVEAVLHDCFVKPLTEFMQRQEIKQTGIPFPPPRGLELKSCAALTKLSLREWGDILDILATSHRKSLAGLATNELNQFIRQHLGERLPDFRQLSYSLCLVSRYRSGSAHYQEAATRCEKEEWELEQMRKLVLGIDSASVIVRIFELLGRREQHP